MEILQTISAFFVVSGIVSSLIIAFDLRHHEQHMKIMNSVWVLTALWANWFALGAYYRFGRAGKMSGGKPGGPGMPMPRRPRWQSVVLSTLHCGAGCTLADLTGEWFLYFVPLAIGGSLLAGSWVFDYLLALIFGIGFQYAAVRSMEPVSPRQALYRAAKADFLSLTAWQAGMYGWMAFAMFVWFAGSMPPRTSWTFWFMMQVAMGFGFLCSYPVNSWLLHAGIKKEM
ncbi:MAG: DUF4396 domain-containing protein [Parabacteroides sp.]|nr:DUF4396 domain-containing protein [Parabacteroides sp.]